MPAKHHVAYFCNKCGHAQAMQDIGKTQRKCCKHCRAWHGFTRPNLDRLCLYRCRDCDYRYYDTPEQTHCLRCNRGKLVLEARCIPNQPRKETDVSNTHICSVCKKKACFPDQGGTRIYPRVCPRCECPRIFDPIGRNEPSLSEQVKELEEDLACCQADNRKMLREIVELTQKLTDTQRELDNMSNEVVRLRNGIDREKLKNLIDQLNGIIGPF